MDEQRVKHALEHLENNTEKRIAGVYVRIKAVCKEALHKQIPKKPVEHSCPICNGTDIEVWQAGGYSATKFDYCPRCGQRIDWSIEEDE